MSYMSSAHLLLFRDVLRLFQLESFKFAGKIIYEKYYLFNPVQTLLKLKVLTIKLNDYLAINSHQLHFYNSAMKNVLRRLCIVRLKPLEEWLVSGFVSRINSWQCNFFTNLMSDGLKWKMRLFVTIFIILSVEKGITWSFLTSLLHSRQALRAALLQQ